MREASIKISTTMTKFGKRSINGLAVAFYIMFGSRSFNWKGHLIL
jgi:hypothetical protein